MAAKQFLKKVVKVRSHLIKSGDNQKPKARMLAKLAPLKRWCEAYPNAPEGGALRIIKKYQADIIELLPGKNCKSAEKLHQEFYQLLNIN